MDSLKHIEVTLLFVPSRLCESAPPNNGVRLIPGQSGILEHPTDCYFQAQRSSVVVHQAMTLSSMCVLSFAFVKWSLSILSAPYKKQKINKSLGWGVQDMTTHDKNPRHTQTHTYSQIDHELRQILSWQIQTTHEI